jgi:hypothetical protein
MECAELASSVRTPELKVMFSELSRGWENLALAIEDVDAAVAESDVGDKKLN